MALGSNPSRNQIYLELTASEYRNSGADNNHLQDMYEYVFKDSSGNYSRNAFGGYGIPDISSSLTVTNEGNEQLTVQFSITDWNTPTGSSLEAWAQYYDESLGGFPSASDVFTQSIATYSSTGSTGTQNGTITGLTNGTTYNIRVTLTNGFNNYTPLIPNYPTVNSEYNWTNDVTGTPQPPQLITPTISGGTLEYNGVDGYISFNYSGNEDDFDVEVRIDGSTTETATVDCDKNVGSSTNPVEIRFSYTTFPTTGVEFRVRATSTTLTDSNWSSWVSATEVGLFALPTCPL